MKNKKTNIKGVSSISIGNNKNTKNISNKTNNTNNLIIVINLAFMTKSNDNSIAALVET
jgi:hypothetical protein